MRDRRQLPANDNDRRRGGYSPAPAMREEVRQERRRELEQQHLVKNQQYFFRYFADGEAPDRLEML